MQREVISRRVLSCPYTGRHKRIEVKYDYSSLDVGDWFLVESRAFAVGAKRSMKRNQISKDMEFAWIEIEPRVWRVERAA